jgi:hypothetical protein
MAFVAGDRGNIRGTSEFLTLNLPDELAFSDSLRPVNRMERV